MKNKSFYVYLLIIVLGCFLTSCAPSADEACQMTLGYFDLIAHEDFSTLAALGLEEAELLELTQSIRENYKSAVSNTLSQQGLLSIPEEDLEALTTAYFKALKQTEASCQILSQTKDTCMLQLSFSSIDSQSINTTAADLAFKNINHLSYTDTDAYLQDLTSKYIAELVQGYNTTQATTNLQTLDIIFTRYGQTWIPDDLNNLVLSIFNQIG